jgi:gamma-glutamylcyclotransferase (GGCT)/AIG2-like uncharacterized protein YtfP
MTVARLFVYGTLKPGFSRWPALMPHVAAGAEPTDDTVEGRLWKTPWGWPALTAGSNQVSGALVSLSPGGVDTALTELDEIEGVGSGLFERVLATTGTGDVCWLYWWPGPTDGFAEIDGQW